MYHSITFAKLDTIPEMEFSEEFEAPEVDILPDQGWEGDDTIIDLVGESDIHFNPVLYGKNTWDDWHLVPASRPVFNPPSLKEHIVDIPGKDGVLDFTEALTGYPMFERREGTFEFIVMNGYQEWHQLYSDMMLFLHGKKLRAVLEDDPDYFYEGRFMIQEWKSEKDYSRVIIAYKVDPYKWSILTSSQLSAYYTKSLSASKPFTTIGFLPNILGAAAAIPTITVTDGSVDCGYNTHDDDGIVISKTVRLTQGDHVMYDAPITRDSVINQTGTTGFTFTRVSGDPVTVSVSIRRGEL